MFISFFCTYFVIPVITYIGPYFLSGLFAVMISIQLRNCQVRYIYWHLFVRCGEVISLYCMAGSSVFYSNTSTSPNESVVLLIVTESEEDCAGPGVIAHPINALISESRAMCVFRASYVHFVTCVVVT
jgi:hypothetical protein